MSSCTSRAATGSSPEVGSSRKTICGSLRRARASPTRPQRLLDPRTRVGEPVQSGEELEVLGDAQAEVEAGVLGHDRDALPDLEPVRAADGEAGDLGRAGARSDQRAERADHGGLAGPVRPEEAEDLPALDRERHVREGEAVAEPLGQAVDDDRRRARGSPVAGRRHPDEVTP
jgi:hypothetical protein